MNKRWFKGSDHLVSICVKTVKLMNIVLGSCKRLHWTFSTHITYESCLCWL